MLDWRVRAVGRDGFEPRHDDTRLALPLDAPQRDWMVNFGMVISGKWWAVMDSNHRPKD